MDEVAGQLSQSKWEEIQKKKILLANEMRLAGKAMLDFRIGSHKLLCANNNCS